MTPEQKIEDAIALIASVPGYETVAQSLRRRSVRFVAHLEDRGEATLTGAILIGPEALGASVVGLAETLVHEEFHTRQNPLWKTHSFWLGVFTRTPVMARYERPAYEAAADFLEAVAQAHPSLASEARAEAELVRSSFANFYGT